MKSPLTIEARFWSKVDRTSGGCWLWKAGKSTDGYGVFQPIIKQVRAHRFAWQLTHGEIPEGLFICHTCDTPACCNPNHLFIGTHEDNVKDKVAKGRQVREDRHASRLYPARRPQGDSHKSAKLRSSQISEIRRLYHSQRPSYKKLATQFDVSEPLIGRIIRRELWRHLPEPVESN